MTSPQKAKGNSWERDLCQFLISTLGGNFQRVPNSGAILGKSNYNNRLVMDESQITLFKGDIIVPDFLTKMVLECKFYKEFPFHSLVKDSIPILDKWIEQTKDCIDAGDVWFLAIKINRRGSFVVFEEIHKPLFKLSNHTIYKSFVFTDLEKFFTENVEIIKQICKK